ncbi:hypothetical protein ACB092_03G151400 [Castanea dentata]
MEVEARYQHEVNILQLSVVNEKLSANLSCEDALRFQLESAIPKHELKLLRRPLAPSQNPMAPPFPLTPFFHTSSSTSPSTGDRGLDLGCNDPMKSASYICAIP